MRLTQWKASRGAPQPLRVAPPTPRIVIATRSSYAGGPSPLRRRLFARVAAASLRGQTDPDFTWLVRVDPTEDVSWRHEITAGLQVIFSTEDWSDALRTFGPIRMARMDDDDALAIDFVERLKAAGSHQPGTWYTFANGWRVHHGRCEPYANRPNQFVALDVPSGGEQHVYSINHRDLERTDFAAPILDVDDRPAWLFVRHDESKSAGGRQRTTRPLSTLRGQFAVDAVALSSRDVPAGDDYPCKFRGDLVETIDCKPCETSTGSATVSVFACSHPQRKHHPVCTLQTVAARGSDGMRPKGCSTCALRKEA